MRIKKTILSLLSFLLMITLSAPSAAALYGADCDVPAMSLPTGGASLVLELTTGTVLYEHNADQRKYPASTTKLMTALLTAEHLASGAGALSDEITFSYDAIYGIPRDSSNIALDVGEILSVEYTLYAMLVSSANEACLGMAEYIAGSIPAFIERMNERAAALGMTGTHYVTANGLHDANHYTTARDMALLMQEVLKHSLLREVMSTVSFSIPPTNKNNTAKPLLTTNHLINPSREYYNSKVVCGKTGFTSAAGNTLVTYSEYNGLQYIVVLLDSSLQKVMTETSKIVNYFSEHLKAVTVYDTIDFAQSIPLSAGGGMMAEPAEPFAVLCHAKDDYHTYERVYTGLPSLLSTPTAAGTVLGTLTLYDHGYPVSSVALVARTDYMITPNTDPPGSSGETTPEPGGTTAGTASGGTTAGTASGGTTAGTASGGAKEPANKQVFRVVVTFLLVLLGVALLFGLIYGVFIVISLSRYNKRRK